MQWPGSGKVFSLVVDLFSLSASLAYLTMLEPINELHVAMFAVFSKTQVSEPLLHRDPRLPTDG
jgi:hypothetical protein